MCPTPSNLIDWSLLDKLRRWLGLRLARHEIALLLDELSRRDTQYRAVVRERERYLKPVAAVASVFGRGKARSSFGVITWINPSLVEACIGGTEDVQEVIESVAKHHFRRHLWGAFTSGAPSHLFPALEHHDPLTEKL